MPDGICFSTRTMRVSQVSILKPGLRTITMPNFLQVTPVLAMKDLPAAVRFFVDLLGFHAWVADDYYAYVQRDSAGVRLSKASRDCAEESFDYGPRTFLFYLDVKDLTALVEEIRPRLIAAGLAPGDGPVDQTWGQREWWVSGPEGGLIVFGEAYTAMPAAPLPAL